MDFARCTVSQPSVILVARDFAPSQAFNRLAPALSETGWIVTTVLGHGKPLSDNLLSGLISAVADAKVVVIGMSAPAENAADEITVALEASELSIPVVLYVDTFGAWSRAWFVHVRSGVKLVFLPHEHDLTECQAMFPGTQVVVTGNPVWEEFGLPLSLDRLAVREMLQVPADHGWIIASPGGKDRNLNLICWRALRALVEEIRELRVFITRHPGDKTPQAEYEEMLWTTERFRFAPDSITSSDLVTAANALVEPNPTSLAIQAAMAVRIPVLTMMSPAGRLRMAQVSGTTEWPLWPLGVGASTTVESLSRDLGDMLTGNRGREMVQRQREVFPNIPPVGTAVANMLAALEQFRR